MKEFELKFEVPADRVEAVAAEFAQSNAAQVRLPARYFDTADGLLYRHGVTVRLRQEGAQWVQTAKGRTGSLLERLEHNVTVDPAGAEGPPAVDLARHRDAPIGDVIKRALKRNGGARPPLQLLFEADVGRKSQEVEFQGSRIEVAFDQGWLVAGPRSQPVCELEFELKEGDAADAVALAAVWCTRHRLWLCTASKAERGRRLAAGLLFGEPVGAPPIRNARHPGEIFRAALASCLDQILANASEVASGSTDAGHIHQLRVGIRRLRTAVRDLPHDLQACGDWEGAMVDVFRGLGKHRDQRHVALSLEPVIEEAGGPLVSTDAMAGEVPDPAALVRSAPFQQALLELLGLLHRSPGRRPAKKRARKALKGRLDKLRNTALVQGKQFVQLEEDRQHDVRKRLKRLRYLTEFVAPLFKGGKTAAFQKELKPVQDALGVYNDELMALKTYRRLARQEPKAWFGAGWLSGRSTANAQACRKVINKFSKAQPFWK
jgi:inorganic triphosphatase YgiF